MKQKDKFQSNYNIFCGYNHSISKSFAYFFNKIKEIENRIYSSKLERGLGWNSWCTFLDEK